MLGSAPRSVVGLNSSRLPGDNQPMPPSALRSLLACCSVDGGTRSSVTLPVGTHRGVLAGS